MAVKGTRRTAPAVTPNARVYRKTGEQTAAELAISALLAGIGALVALVEPPLVAHLIAPTPAWLWAAIAAIPVVLALWLTWRSWRSRRTTLPLHPSGLSWTDGRGTETIAFDHVVHLGYDYAVEPARRRDGVACRRL
jgi:hypothetical protein